MVKVGVHLGLTLCTDPENRNFARFGMDISDIDLDGDVEAQANAAVSAVMTVTTIANEGLEEAVTVALTELPQGRTIGGELTELQEQLNHIRKNMVPNIVGRIQLLSAHVGYEAPTEGAASASSPLAEEESTGEASA